MTSLSPRAPISTGMANVAEDFQDSLRDLNQNNRYEISNLTLIAKESTEHAQAISKALENHIKTTAPNRKLPALYVLDSIVKNVGTPYTVYLSRNLYSTFMEAYTLVDSVTRRSMEGMLRTWKEPVPGSLDPRPVFPPETVRPIETALLKAKTAALQNQRGVTPQPPYRGTTTPPQYIGQHPIPGHHPSPFQAHVSGMEHSPSFFNNVEQQQSSLSFPNANSLHTQYRATPPPSHTQQSDYESVLHDTQALISTMQAQFAANPIDQALITKLQALLQLQQILRTQASTLRPTDLQQIKSQISSLSSTTLRVSTPLSSTFPAPTAMPPIPVSYAAPMPSLNSLPNTSSPAPGSLPSAPVFAPGALDSLQALLASTNKPSTPQIRTAVPALQHASHTQLAGVQSQVTGAPTLNSTDLLAALAKNNLLPIPTPSLPSAFPPPQPAAPTPAVAATSVPGSTEALLASISKFLPPATSPIAAVTTSSAKADTVTRIPMTATALKVFRPELVRNLYDAQPNQCNNCGRRFLATEDGREKKSRHLDWHFRTNQRMADASTNRGHHRNWFIDEMAWIRLVEYDPSTTTADEAARLNNPSSSDANGRTGPGGKRVEDSYVRAPAGMTMNTCSICYEEMKSTYNDDVQDWVFTNAVTYGSGGAPGPNRIVHATCADEIRRTNPTAHTAHVQPVTAGFGGVLSTNSTPSSSSLAAALAGLTNSHAVRGATPRSRSGTPDSALGKRKAPSALQGNSGARVKLE